MTTKLAAKIIAWAAAAAVLFSLPVLAPFTFLGVHIGVTQIGLIGVWVIAALGLNIVTGYCGQISLAHGVFVTVGAFAAALLTNRADWPFWAAVPAGGLVAAVTGIPVGLPALRLSGFHLAIVTLVLGAAITPALVKFDGITGGNLGLIVSSPSRPEVLDFLSKDEWLAYLCLAAAAVMTLAARNLVRSRWGRGWMATRDSELGTQAMGVSPAYSKLLAFSVSAFYGGIAGGLYVQIMGGITPNTFGFMASVTLLSMVAIGGLSTLAGSVLAGAMYVIFPEVLRALSGQFPGLTVGEFTLRDLERTPSALYAVMLIIVVSTMPSGLAGVIERRMHVNGPFHRWYLAFTAPSRLAAQAFFNDVAPDHVGSPGTTGEPGDTSEVALEQSHGGGEHDET
ncbi:MAG: branched-chain amino acid ABC transporter permease [Dehalococcoidia bacterium]|nr:MAG: branched-chain amino acid ABC transporter permease [Dehalococcoidia bacterium]